MPRLPKPFSFISWEECFQVGYDHFCQELWDWSDYVDLLYPPHIPLARLPWRDDPAQYDVPNCGENIFYWEGTVSAWALLSTEIQLEDYFLPDYDSCEWEPYDSPMFWDDLGFILYAHWDDYCTASEPERVAALLEDLPNDTCLPSFKNELLDSCTRRSIEKATGLYLAYDFDYCGSPVFGKFCSGLVEFLGSFSYNGHNRM